MWFALRPARDHTHQLPQLPLLPALLPERAAACLYDSTAAEPPNALYLCSPGWQGSPLGSVLP